MGGLSKKELEQGAIDWEGTIKLYMQYFFKIISIFTVYRNSDTVVHFTFVILVVM